MSTGALKTRPLICGLIAAACFCLVALAGTAGAENASVLQSRIDDARAQADELGARIDANASAIAEALSRAEAAARREAELSAVLEEAEVKLAELERHVDLTEAELGRVRDRLADARDLLAARLIAIYKVGVPDATELLLSSDGFDDLTTRAPYLSKIQESDTILAGRIRQLRDEVYSSSPPGVRHATVKQHSTSASSRPAIRSRARAPRPMLAPPSSVSFAAGRRRRSASCRTTSTAGRSGSRRSSGSRPPRPSSRSPAGSVITRSRPRSCSANRAATTTPSTRAAAPAGRTRSCPTPGRATAARARPQDGSKQEQDSIAAQIWADSGSAPWVCG